MFLRPSRYPANTFPPLVKRLTTGTTGVVGGGGGGGGEEEGEDASEAFRW